MLIISYVNSQELSVFNKPGNACYFQYLRYTPNQDYSTAKRPLIFILGKPNETPKETFDKDSLKNLSQFNSYLFVYISNNGKSVAMKLDCIDALCSMITFDYSSGYMNIFLQINDDSVSRKDISTYGIFALFKAVRLSCEFKKNGDTNVIHKTVIEDFKATATLKEGDEEDTEEEEPDGKIIDKNIEAQSIKQQKIYFGPPSMYNFALSGIIRDKLSGEALPFATLQVKGTSTGTTTNTDGYFTLLKVPSDTCTLQVNYIGYSKTDFFLTPQLPKKNLLIEVLPTSHTLNTVIVTANREEVILVNKSDISSIKMTPLKLEQLPNIGEKDIMRSFQLMPGISASNESSSGLYVRGGTPDQNLVLYDGFTVYHVDHLYGFFSAFNSNALKDVQVYKGGFESKFGGRLSSVTEITGKEGNQKKFNIGADLSLLCVNAYIEVPIGKKISSIVTFRKSYQGFIYNKIFSKFNLEKSSEQPQGGSGGRFSQETKATSYFYDLNARVTYKPTLNDNISISFFNGTDKLDNGFESNSPSGIPVNFNMSSTDITKYGNIGSSLKWARKWTSKIYGNTIASYSNYFSNRNRSQERMIIDTSGESNTINNGIFENNDLKDFSLKSDYQKFHCLLYYFHQQVF